jgi:uncharacterized protein Yka (UPF0111/DUF47 family)
MEKIILTPEELKQLQETQQQKDKMSLELGQIELELDSLKRRKQSILEKSYKLENDMILLGNSLESKYGNGTIDLETGEFTKIN